MGTQERFILHLSSFAIKIIVIKYKICFVNVLSWQIYFKSLSYFLEKTNLIFGNILARFYYALFITKLPVSLIGEHTSRVKEISKWFQFFFNI